MSKLIIFLGVLLMVAAMGLLIFFVGVRSSMQDNQSVVDLQNRLFCNPNETYVEVLGGYIRNSTGTGGGRQFTAYCENSENQRRDVTLRAFGIMAGAFAIPFVLGLFLFIGGVGAFARRKVTNMISTFPIQAGQAAIRTSVVQMDKGDIDAGNVGEMLQEVFSRLQNANYTVVSSSMGGADDLTEKLRQLKEARDSNLISQDEYERIRAAILDKLDD